MKMKKLGGLLLAGILFLQCAGITVFAAASVLETMNLKQYGFQMKGKQESKEGTAYVMQHIQSGATVFYVDNGSEKREFTAGFRSPAESDMGENHVLEHALLCGNKKYPSKNLMYYLRNSSVAEEINASTWDDATTYFVKTKNEADYYNLMDVYMNCVLFPNLLEEENIFKQQGIRKEYADGKVQYNGVVYNELRLRSYDAADNSLEFVSGQMFRNLYGDQAPACSSGGTVEGIKNLTYADVLRVYQTYYKPANCMVYLAGKQDIAKTLSLLNSYWKAYQNGAPEISWQVSPQKPETAVDTYGITEETKTVDIGIMYSGVPVLEQRKSFARDIILKMVAEPLIQQYPNYYTTGSFAGGVSAMAAIFSGVPVEEKDQVVGAYQEGLQAMRRNGFEAEQLRETVRSYESGMRSVTGWEQSAFNGFVYGGDPLLLQNAAADFDYLAEHPDYFREVLDSCFLNNPYQTTVICGNGGKQQESGEISVTPEELEQIKQDTQQFQAWVSQPDTPEELKNNPVLSKEALQEFVPLESQQTFIDDIPCYTDIDEKADNNSGTLEIQAMISQAEIQPAFLLVRYLNHQAKARGIKGIYFDLTAIDQYHDATQADPRFYIGFSGEAADLPAVMEQGVALLQDETVLKAEKLEAFLAEEAKTVRSNYRDPYSVSYELMMSSQSQGDKFRFAGPGSIGKGSITYAKYVELADAGLLPVLRDILARYLNRSGLVCTYTGGREGYQQFQKGLPQVLAQMRQIEREPANFVFPSGYHSAATVTTQSQDVSHIMQAGYYGGQNRYSGKLHVVAKVLTANYLLPELRGKYGAYGTSVRFDETRLVCAVAGITDVDLALRVFRGMGDYLRGLELTEQELNSFIISALSEFDQAYQYESGGYNALRGKTTEDSVKEREEILSISVADIKAYAAFIDELMAQQRVFAVVNTNALEQTAFPFAYHVDANSFEITPRLMRTGTPFMKGVAEERFAPDAPVTRGELAVLFARLMVDQNQSGPGKSFQDVAEQSWYAGAISFLANQGILNGYEDNTFHPDQSVSREEFAALAARFVGGGQTGSAQFTDVKQSGWSYQAIGKMAQAGYLTGYSDGTFQPTHVVTRAEVAVVLNRMLERGQVADPVNLFADVPSDHWAYEEILKAANRTSETAAEE